MLFSFPSEDVNVTTAMASTDLDLKVLNNILEKACAFSDAHTSSSAHLAVRV